MFLGKNVIYFMVLFLGMLMRGGAGYGQESFHLIQSPFTPDNGLAGRFGNYTFKDSRGIIWMGTQHGLHRYDGRELRVFDERHGLPFSEIMEIYEDDQGWLWLYRSCLGKQEDYCFRTLTFFHPLTFEVRSLEERFGAPPPFSVEAIQFIQMSPSRRFLVIGTDSGWFSWTSQKGFRPLPKPSLPGYLWVFSLLDDGRLGILQRTETEWSFVLADTSGRSLRTEPLPGNPEPDTWSAFGYPPKRSPYKRAIAASEGEEELVYELDEQGRLVRATPALKLWMSMNNPSCRHVFHDTAQQTLWIAGRQGITSLQYEPKRFGFFPTSYRMDIPVFVGSGLGDELIVSAIREIYSIGPEEARRAAPDLGEITTEAPDWSRVEDIEVLQTQTMLLRLAGGEARLFRPDGAYPQLERLQAAAKVGDAFWIGTRNGLYVLAPEPEAAGRYVLRLPDEPLAGASIHCIAQPEGSDYWVGTNKGLFRLSDDARILGQYGNQSTGDAFFPAGTIYHLALEKNGVFWMATRSGLLKWGGPEGAMLPSGRRYVLFTQKDGLPDQNCVAVYADPFGFVWVATVRGIVQVQSRTNRFRTYFRNDGLQQEYFFEYAHCRDASGRLDFGGLGGVTRIDPADFRHTRFDPAEVPIILVDFEQYNAKAGGFENRTYNLLRDSIIYLAPGECVFSIRLALADYRQSDRQQFSYRISGVQESWDTLSSNDLRISGLPYGEHLLEIRARLPDGRFSAQTLSLPVRVIRPLFFQPWFIVLVNALLLGLIWFLYRRRLKTQRARQFRLEETVRERTQTIRRQSEALRQMDKHKDRFFANVSHELRTPLTLLSGPLQILTRSSKLSTRDRTLVQLAEKNARDLLKLVNQLLDLTKLDAHKMDLQESSVEIRALINNKAIEFEPIARQKNIDFLVDVRQEDGGWFMLDADKVETLLNNLLSNAFKFTPRNGRVKLQATCDGELLRLTVRDTGRGIPPEEQDQAFERYYQSRRGGTATAGGTGIGLALCRELVRLMKGRIWVESQPGNGAAFFVDLPVRKALPLPDLNHVNPDDLPSASPAKDATTEGLPGTGLDSVLVVEDHSDLQAFLEFLLEPRCKVSVADNGAEAWELLQEGADHS